MLEEETVIERIEQNWREVEREREREGGGERTEESEKALV